VISLEKAKKLKEAGLEWEPKQGDFYWFVTPDESRIGFVQNNRGAEGFKAHVDRCRGIVWCTYVFAPRLDQLLAEIEKWGYSWEMRTVIDESQSVRFNAKNIAYWIHVWKTGHIEWEDGFKRAFTSPSNAAASALLWIYEGRAKA